MIKSLQSYLGCKDDENSMKDIRGIHEEHKRSALKTVSWRIIATSSGMFLVYIFTGQLELTVGFGISDVALKMLFYFLHERIWDRIAFGRSLSGTVESAIRSPPVTVAPSDTALTVVEKMVTSDVGAAIVMDDDKPQGLITEGDIIERVVGAGRDSSEILARDVMSSPVATVEYDQPLTYMLNLMRDKHIRRLVVTQKGRVIGIVTERRILEALI